MLPSFIGLDCPPPGFAVLSLPPYGNTRREVRFYRSVLVPETPEQPAWTGLMSQTSHGPVTLRNPRSWYLDIDRFINPFVPAPRWHLVPKPIAYILGYRDKPTKPLGNVLTAFWALIGAFCGVALVAEVSKRVPSFESRNAPTIVGSFVSHARPGWRVRGTSC